MLATDKLNASLLDELLELLYSRVCSLPPLPLGVPLVLFARIWRKTRNLSSAQAVDVDNCLRAVHDSCRGPLASRVPR